MQKGIIKNVNRITGEPIDAKDLASLFSGIIGEESGVLTVFEELRLEKINDNKVRLHSGVYSLKGHILYIPKGSYEDFEIESGTLGANRIDLLVSEYVKNGEGDGEDTLRFRVIKGETTSGTPEKPDLIQQDVNENGITRQEVLYELRLTGLNLSIQSRISSIRNIETLGKETEGEFNELRGYINRTNFPHFGGSTRDANGFSRQGIYTVDATTTNTPYVAGVLVVFPRYQGNIDNLAQMMIGVNGLLWIRYKDKGTFTNWREF